MKTLTKAGLVLVILVVLTAGPVSAGTNTFTSNEKLPLDMIVYVSCANGGMGEYVYLTGTLHVLYHTTLDNAGGYHLKMHFQPQGVRGVGLTTGKKYRGTGVTQEQFNGKLGNEYTFVNNFRIIGQGPGNNYLVHETFHVTVNAKGKVTAEVSNFRVQCK